MSELPPDMQQNLGTLAKWAAKEPDPMKAGVAVIRMVAAGAKIALLEDEDLKNRALSLTRNFRHDKSLSLYDLADKMEELLA